MEELKKSSEDRICIGCSKEFLWKSSRPIQKYCSPECRNKNNPTRYKKLEEDFIYRKICKGCGINFSTKTSNKRYCSGNCSAKSRYKKESERIKSLWKIENRKCVGCGNIFIWNSSIKKKKYCSEECCKRDSVKKQRIKYKKDSIIENRKCVGCGNIFIWNSKNKHKKFCNRVCYDENYNYKGRNEFLRLRFEIFKRDNFTCQYCGKNVKDDGKRIHCDHIVPLSKNGKNIKSNLITSCKECNLGKSDVLLEERKQNKMKYSKNVI